MRAPGVAAQLRLHGDRLLSEVTPLQWLLLLVADCIVLVRRLLVDPRTPRSRKLLLGLLVGYLALPFDLVPDFIPVAGQLDDAVVVALALRAVLRGGGPELLREHWPGPESSLALVLRLVGAT